MFSGISPPHPSWVRGLAMRVDSPAEPRPSPWALWDGEVAQLAAPAQAPSCRRHPRNRPTFAGRGCLSPACHRPWTASWGEWTPRWNGLGPPTHPRPAPGRQTSEVSALVGDGTSWGPETGRRGSLVPMRLLRPRPRCCPCAVLLLVSCSAGAPLPASGLHMTHVVLAALQAGPQPQRLGGVALGCYPPLSPCARSPRHGFLGASGRIKCKCRRESPAAFS